MDDEFRERLLDRIENKEVVPVVGPGAVTLGLATSCYIRGWRSGCRRIWFPLSSWTHPRRIEFVNLIVNHLAEHGQMEARRLYESPFTDLTPHGPEGLFTEDAVDELIGVLDAVRSTALAA